MNSNMNRLETKMDSITATLEAAYMLNKAEIMALKCKVDIKAWIENENGKMENINA